MSNEPYPKEELEAEDDGTIPGNIETLESAVIGHKIVSAEQGSFKGNWGQNTHGLVLTLDNGTKVQMADTSDCCAYTELEGFFIDPSSYDHMIMGVGTTEDATVWHIYADFGDVMKMNVGWSCGNPFYYGYGFDITVVPLQNFVVK